MQQENAEKEQLARQILSPEWTVIEGGEGGSRVDKVLFFKQYNCIGLLFIESDIVASSKESSQTHPRRMTRNQLSKGGEKIRGDYAHSSSSRYGITPLPPLLHMCWFLELPNIRIWKLKKLILQVQPSPTEFVELYNSLHSLKIWHSRN